MADDPGRTIPAASYPKLVEVVRAYDRTPQPPYMRPQPRRRPVFQPSPGGKVYQCVSGSKLILGTAASPDDGSIYEPVAVCVQLGTASDDALIDFTNNQIFRLQQLISQLGIVGPDNTISRALFQAFNEADAVTQITGRDSGIPGSGLTLLRTRFCQGYVGTGSIVIGNDTEAWYAVGNQVFEATLDAAWIDGTTQSRAKITFNQGAIDESVAVAGVISKVSPSRIHLPSSSFFDCRNSRSALSRRIPHMKRSHFRFAESLSPSPCDKPISIAAG